MSQYARKTTVSVEKSRLEIEALLKRYGATGFMYGWQEGREMIAFELNRRKVRLELPMPDKNSRAIVMTPSGRRRTAAQVEQEYAQAVRQRWRAFGLIIKAKLEAIECGVATFESEFLHGLLLPGGETVGEWLQPRIEAVYLSGQMPPLLPG